MEEKTSPFAVAGFRLLALTGCRCSEVFRLQWKEVKLDRGVLEFAKSKTGARKVPLNAAAVEVLKALPRIEGNEHVIVGAVRGQPFRGEAKVWERIRERAGLDDLRIHDLRSTRSQARSSTREARWSSWRSCWATRPLRWPSGTGRWA